MKTDAVEHCKECGTIHGELCMCPTEKSSAELSLLGPKHTGMKVSVSGLLGRIADGWKVDKGQRYMVGEMLKHLKQVGERYYSGDVKAVDEFLQLYCLADTRP